MIDSEEREEREEREESERLRSLHLPSDGFDRPRRPELERLLPRHYRLVELFLDGHNVKTVAQAVGMTPQTVSIIYKSPLFQSELARRRARRELHSDAAADSRLSKARQVLLDSAEDAANVHVSLLSSDDPRIAQLSANAILDRVFEKTEKTGHPTVVISADKLSILQVALKEAQRIDK